MPADPRGGARDALKLGRMARYREDLAFTPGNGQGRQARGQSGPPSALRGRGGYQATVARTRRRGISIGCRAIGRLWGKS